MGESTFGFTPPCSHLPFPPPDLLLPLRRFLSASPQIPDIHTICSHVLFTPPVHTFCSHFLFTPPCSHLLFTSPVTAVFFLPPPRFQISTRSVHTSSSFFSHLPFTLPVYTSYSHLPVHTYLFTLPFQAPVHRRFLSFLPRFQIFTQSICSHVLFLLFTPHVHTSYSHLPIHTYLFTPTCSRFLFRLLLTALSISLFPPDSRYSHDLYTPPVHTSRSHLLSTPFTAGGGHGRCAYGTQAVRGRASETKHARESSLRG